MFLYNVLTDKGTRLDLNKFETLVLLKDWYNVEGRLHDKLRMHMSLESGSLPLIKKEEEEKKTLLVMCEHDVTTYHMIKLDVTISMT